MNKSWQVGVGENLGAYLGSCRIQKGTRYSEGSQNERKAWNVQSSGTPIWWIFCNTCRLGMYMDTLAESSVFGTLFLRFCWCVAERECEYSMVLTVLDTHHTFWIIFFSLFGHHLQSLLADFVHFLVYMFFAVFLFDHFWEEPGNSEKQRVTASNCGSGGMGSLKQIFQCPTSEQGPTQNRLPQGL